MTSLLIGGAVILTAALAYIAASNRLKIRNYTIASDKITSPLRIVHVSDLHESLFGEGQHKLLEAIRMSKPDMIVITGDIVEDDESDPREGQVLTTDNRARMLLSPLGGIAPCFMVLGNHESNIPMTDMLCDEIEALGIRLLHRRNRDDPDMYEEVSLNGEHILVCGADDPYFDRREPYYYNSLSERLAEDKSSMNPIIVGWRERLLTEYPNVHDDKRLTLLLSHRPEEFELYKRLGFDAAFSGHAHGGQWRLPPFINGVYAPHQGFFPRHAGGCYRYGDFTHIVSRGLSKKRMIRIFNRPEVCVVSFEPKKRK